MTKIKKGDRIIVRGTGALYGEGVPKNMDGRQAKVLSVGPKLLKVMIQGEWMARKIRISTDVKRRLPRGK